MLHTTNGHAAPLADTGGELFPAHYPKIELETTVLHEGFTFRVVFRDTSLADAVQVLQRRGCTPAAPLPASPAPNAPAAPNGDLICPKHQRKLKPSQFGGYFCTAADEDEANGRCRYKAKATK
jgi:hypothetical protein